MVAELQFGATPHYALSASLSEAYDVASGMLGTQWQSTGRVWTAWPLDTPGTIPVHRFYLPSAVEAGAHFYTSSAQEVQGLRASGSPWIDEGPQFAAKALAACTPRDVMLARYYKADARTGLPRHRYLGSGESDAALVGQGWIREGDVMCVAAKIAPP